jgi:hypothetical protein
LLLLALCLGAQAEEEMCTIQNPKPGCTDAAPTLQLPPSTKSQLETIADQAKAHGVKSEIKTYAASDLPRVLKRTEKQLARALPNRGGCHYMTLKDTEACLAKLSRLKTRDAVTAAIRKLAEQGLVTAAIGRASPADKDQCRRQSFQVFTKDGYVLCLDYDLASAH